MPFSTSTQAKKTCVEGEKKGSKCKLKQSAGWLDGTLRKMRRSRKFGGRAANRKGESMISQRESYC